VHGRFRVYLYVACQTAITLGGLLTDTGINELPH